MLTRTCFNGLLIFGKKSSCGGFKSETTPDQQFAKKLYKLIIRKSEKVYSFFKDSVWRADLADVQ